MISIVKKSKSKNLYVQFYIDGRCIQRSTKLKDTKENRSLIKKKVIPPLELKILNGEFNTKQEVKNFRFFSERYLAQKASLKSYREWYNLVHNQLIPVFGERDITSIKRYEITEWAELRLKDISAKRVRTILNVISAIFNIAVDYEVLGVNPSRSIKLPFHLKEEFEPFTQDEVGLLLEQSNGWLKNYLAFAFFTGARPGELLALQWSDIDLDARIIAIERRVKKGAIDTPKTKSSIREVPIFESLVPYIKNQMRTSKEKWVFTNPNTGNMFFSTERLATPWRQLLKECKMEYKIIYTTRHTFITTMLKSGKMNMLTIAQMVGHKNTEMIVKNYARFIKGEHLKVNRDTDIFTDKTTDSVG